MYHFFITSSVYGHLSCFHAQAIENCAAKHTEVHTFLEIMAFFRCMSRWASPVTQLVKLSRRPDFNP